MSNAHILFWASVVLLGYTYLGYPVLMFAWASLRSRPPRPRDSEPPVTVLVVAHNESTRITTRLDNLLSLDYPSDKLEIMIGSDGSTDDTVERARKPQADGLPEIEPGPYPLRFALVHNHATFSGMTRCDS